MHYHRPYNKLVSHYCEREKSGLKCTWNYAGLFLFVYAALDESKCQFSSITLSSTPKHLVITHNHE